MEAYGDHDVYVRKDQQLLAGEIPHATFITYLEDIAVYVTNATTKQLQRAQRAAQ